MTSDKPIPNKQCLVVVEDEALIASFARYAENVWQTPVGIPGGKVTGKATSGGFFKLVPNKPDQFHHSLKDHPERVVLLFLPEEEISHWVWTVIRSQFTNPIIVAGYAGESVFASRESAFKKTTNSAEPWHSHRYMQIPFGFDSLAATINEVVPYKADLGMLKRYYSARLGYVKKMVHELKGAGCEKSRAYTDEALQMALEYFSEIREEGLTTKLREWFELYSKGAEGWENAANRLRENIEKFGGGNEKKDPMR